MHNDDKRDFLALFESLSHVYKDKLSEIKLEVYWRALKNYALVDIKRALDRHFAFPDGGQYIPKAADIIRCLSGSHYGRAARAWTKVQGAIQRIGIYKTVVFDDALIHAVIIDMGGWVNVCQITLHELSYRSRDFERRYCDYLILPPENYVRQLNGLFDSRAIQLVGHSDKAYQVLAGGVSSTALLSYQTVITQALTDIGEEE